jgi:hypothetical protein
VAAPRDRGKVEAGVSAEEARGPYPKVIVMIFEDTNSAGTLDEISRELIQGLPSDLSDPYAANTPWTKAVTDRLRQMGSRRGMLACGHRSQDHGEWLLDVTWMVPERHEIVLAVESEWGELGEVEDDFDKLMSIKARRKLLLFSTKHHEGAGNIMKRIESNMLAYPYHLAGEEYMALEVIAQGAFRYHFQVPSDGWLDVISFNRIGEPLPWPWT